ncbi:hypothetical protein M0805_004463 [Coniferiporia weirii]|nr:hypothetical protein M0805_004463 [Coniferiporia weirii]
MVKTNIIFYDIETRIPGLPTSPNTWRVRLVLNYKRLNYKTVWSIGPTIQQTCVEAGIPPLEKREDGSLRYTMPAIVDLTHPEAPVRLTDSVKIIKYLEETYPDPDPEKALFPKGTQALQALAYDFILESVTETIRPLTVYGMYEKQMELAQPGFRKLREAMFGKKLEEITPKGEARAETWRKVRAILDTVSSFIDNNAEGDDKLFFCGRHPSFIDFHIASALISAKLSVGDEEFRKELESCGEGRWLKLVDVCAPLMK